jgi:HAMP domain-containing protein
MKLGMKFNLVLVGVLVLGLVVIGSLAWHILQRNARAEVVERAGLMMEASLAVRAYTVGEIQPLLAPLMGDRFLPQSVPAYAATQAFGRLREHHGEYTYKEATLNPTNPRNRATDWEADVVELFRNHPDRQEVYGERETPSGRSLYLARPIRIEYEGCLVCHSTPEQAPPSMLARYGANNGFGWAKDEVVGAQVVSVPMTVPEEKARQVFLTFMGSLAGAFLLIIVVLNLMLRRLVVSPVTRMARTADLVSRGGLDAPEFEVRGKDEIATLAAAFNRLRRSLEKAMRMLKR